MFVSFFVPKDLANHCTDVVLLYRVAFIVPGKVYNYFWGGYQIAKNYPPLQVFFIYFIKDIL